MRPRRLAVPAFSATAMQTSGSLPGLGKFTAFCRFPRPMRALKNDPSMRDLRAGCASKSRERNYGGEAMEQPVMSEVVFEVTKESTGGYDAESDTENLSAQGDTWEQLCDNVKTTVERYFQGGPKPQSIRLHHVRDEVLTLT
jgi:hypothetical protein